tara:strand:- start:573 stop:911 length:339 start_codon:yes stop_codon:yes gene_type:complete
MNNIIDKNYLALGVNSSGHSIDSAHSEHAGLQKSNSTEEVQKDLYAAADQFEAIFIEMLLRQARESKLSNELFDSKADDNFEQMFDQEIANSTSKLVDIGIADAIVRQMSKG